MRRQLSLSTIIYNVVALLLLFSACHRRPLVDEMPDRIPIPITILWKEAVVIPQNVSVLFYDDNGDLFLEHVFENQGDVARSKVHLPIGKYTVVVFNEKRNQVDYVRMRGHEQLSTLEAFVTNSTSFYDVKGRSTTRDDKLVNQPGQLATLVTTIDVSPDMLREFNWGDIITPGLLEEFNQLTNLLPVIRTVVVDINIEVKGLNNARMPALGELRNMAGGFLIGQEINTMDPVTTQFTINNRVYDEGSLRDGHISTSIYSLGVMGNRNSTEDSQQKRILFDIFYQLVDKDRTLVEHNLDVTDMIEFYIDDNKTVFRLRLDLTAPEPLPDVKPEGGSDSGLGSELIDWEYVEVPIEM